MSRRSGSRTCNPCGIESFLLVTIQNYWYRNNGSNHFTHTKLLNIMESLILIHQMQACTVNDRWTRDDGRRYKPQWRNFLSMKLWSNILTTKLMIITSGRMFNHSNVTINTRYKIITGRYIKVLDCFIRNI